MTDKSAGKASNSKRSNKAAKNNINRRLHNTIITKGGKRYCKTLWMLDSPKQCLLKILKAEKHYKDIFDGNNLCDLKDFEKHP